MTTASQFHVISVVTPFTFYLNFLTVYYTSFHFHSKIQFRPFAIIIHLLVALFISVTVKESNRVSWKDGLFLLLNQHSKSVVLTMFSIKITFFCRQSFVFW